MNWKKCMSPGILDMKILLHWYNIFFSWLSLCHVIMSRRNFAKIFKIKKVTDPWIPEKWPKMHVSSQGVNKHHQFLKEIMSKKMWLYVISINQMSDPLLSHIRYLICEFLWSFWQKKRCLQNAYHFHNTILTPQKSTMLYVYMWNKWSVDALTILQIGLSNLFSFYFLQLSSNALQSEKNRVVTISLSLP